MPENVLVEHTYLLAVRRVDWKSLILHALFILQSLIRLGVDLPGKKIFTLFQLKIPNICSDKLCDLATFFVMQFTSYMQA